MGRYYKKVDANFVRPEEFLYRPPWEEIKAGIKYQDEQIEKMNTQAEAAITAMATLRRNSKSAYDKALFDVKYAQYAGQMKNFTDSIAKDPLAWRNYTGAMRNLGINLKEDMLKGDLANIQKRADAIKAFEAANKGKMDATWYDKLLKRRIDQMEEGLSKGQYDVEFDDSALYDRKDLRKEFLEFAKNMVPKEVSINGYSDDGRVAVTRNGTKTYLTEKEIGDMFNKFVQDPAMKDYFKFVDDNELEGKGNKYFNEDGSLNLDYSSLANTRNFMSDLLDVSKENVKIDTTESPTSILNRTLTAQKHAHDLQENAEIRREGRAKAAAAREGSGGDPFTDEEVRRAPNTQEIGAAKNNLIKQSNGIYAGLSNQEKSVAISLRKGLKDDVKSLTSYYSAAAQDKRLSASARARFAALAKTGEIFSKGGVSYNKNDVAAYMTMNSKRSTNINDNIAFVNAVLDQNVKGKRVDYLSTADMKFNIYPRDLGDGKTTSQAIATNTPLRKVWETATKGQKKSTGETTESKPFQDPNVSTNINYANYRLGVKLNSKGDPTYVIAYTGYYQGKPVVYEVDATQAGINMNY